MNYLNASAFGSLGLQFATGIFEATGLFSKVRPEDEIVKDVLRVELIVQAIEFVFYVYLVYLIISNGLTNAITSHRYLDWALTTPTMLIGFVVFFKYLQNPKRNIRWFESVKEEQYTIFKIVLANGLMLLLGFLAERSIIDKYVGVTLGFIPFAYVFKTLYADYAKGNKLATNVFYASFVIWSLYGVGAVLPFAAKNTIYNILDLFAKNGYGLFLYFYIKSLELDSMGK
jgi:bacteriorhodopsin